MNNEYQKKIIVVLLMTAIVAFVVIRAIIEIGAAIATLVVSCIGLGAIIIASLASLLTIIYSVLAIVGTTYICVYIAKKVINKNKPKDK
jgi:membrane protein implicated in regulation of membrane protease activity